MALIKWAARVLQSKIQSPESRKRGSKTKVFEGSDRSLQLGYVKKESPVIVAQLTTVKIRVLLEVLTARHVLKDNRALSLKFSSMNPTKLFWEEGTGIWNFFPPGLLAVFLGVSVLCMLGHGGWSVMVSTGRIWGVSLGACRIPSWCE